MQIRDNARKLMTGAAMVSVVAMLLAGCGGSSSSSDKRLASDGKPEVKIQVLKWDNQAAMKDMKWPKELEAACDCHIKWQEVSTTAWDQQKSTALAAGDVADISINGLYYSDAVSQYPYFEDLNKDMSKLPNVKKFLAAQPDAKKWVTDLDGHVYVLPQSAGSTANGSPQRMMINKAWLDKLGLSMPKTWDDLLKVLQAFKNDDPNGDGKKDEIPMDIRKLATNSYRWWDAFLIMNNTGIPTSLNTAPGQEGVYVQDGKVKSWLTDSRYKDAIKLYRTMMQNGYISSDALTHDDSQYDSEKQGEGKTARVGVVFESNNYSLGSDLADQYVALPPMKYTASMPDSQLTWDTSLQASKYGQGTLAVAKNAPNKDAVLKIVNKMYDPDMAIQIKYGTDYVKKTAAKTYTVDPSRYAASLKISPTLNMTTYIPDDYVVKGDLDFERNDKVDQAYLDVQKKTIAKNDYMPVYVKMTTADGTTLSNLYNRVMTYVMTSTGQWIQNGGVDEGWNEYVKKTNDAGLPKILELWQKAYDQQVKK